MNDDDFSGIVRSGSQHSVSVSEHTGNAKNPKNMVVSHEEETEARKRAFEQKALAALEADKAQTAALAAQTEQVPASDAAANANVQKVAADQAVTNRQAIPRAEGVATNVQNVATDVLEANHQQVGADTIQDNIQSIGNNKGAAPNVQTVSADVIAANQQKIAADKKLENLITEATEQVIEVEFDKKVTEQVIAKIENLSSYKNTNEMIWELTFKTDKDMRPIVFDFANSNGLKTLQLNQKNKNLETVFREMTK